MGVLKQAPTPLRRKILLTVLVGLLCLFVGIAVCVMSRDTVMLLLSMAVCGISFFKAFMVYRVIRTDAYETVEGTCTGIIPKLIGKYRKIKIVDDAGIESTLLLGKQQKIHIGER